VYTVNIGEQVKKRKARKKLAHRKMEVQQAKPSLMQHDVWLRIAKLRKLDSPAISYLVIFCMLVGLLVGAVVVALIEIGIG